MAAISVKFLASALTWPWFCDNPELGALWVTDATTSQYSHGGGAAATTAEPSRLLVQSLVNVLRRVWVIGKGWGILPLEVLTLCYRPCNVRIQAYIQQEPYVTITQDNVIMPYQLCWLRCQRQRWWTENNVEKSSQGVVYIYSYICDIYTLC
jgi:hypothetical protein